MTKRIVCAALKHPVYNVIICGARHHDKVMHSVMGNMDADYNDHIWIQGFINTWGEFLTREEAWLVACENNQIIKYVGNQTSDDFGKDGVKLYSENLY